MANNITPEQARAELARRKAAKYKENRAELSAMTQNPAAGQYSQMPWPQKAGQAVDDVMRLAADGLTLGYADKVAAGGNPQALADERAKTNAAHQRSGTAGLAAEYGSAMALPLGAARQGISLAGRFGTAGLEGLKGLAARTGLMGAEGAGYGAGAALGHDQDVSEGAALGLAGGAAGNMSGEALAAALGKLGGMFNRVPQGMSVDELRVAGSDAAQRADNAGVIVKPSGVQGLKQRFEDIIAEHGGIPENEPGVFGAHRRVSDMANDNATMKGLYSVRKTLGNTFNPQNRSQNELARKMSEALDEHFDTLGGDDILAGNPEVASEAYKEMRKYWHRMRKLEQAEGLIDKAKNRAGSTGTGGNEDNAIRQNLRQLLDNSRKGRGYTDDEKEALSKAILGTPGQNALRQVGKLSPKGNALSMMLGIGGTAAMPVVAPAAMAVGAGAKLAADKMTRTNADDLMRLIASGGEKSAVTPAPNALQRLSKSEREALSRAFMGLGVQQFVSP